MDLETDQERQTDQAEPVVDLDLALATVESGRQDFPDLKDKEDFSPSKQCLYPLYYAGYCQAYYEYRKNKTHGYVVTVQDYDKLFNCDWRQQLKNISVDIVWDEIPYVNYRFTDEDDQELDYEPDDASELAMDQFNNIILRYRHRDFTRKRLAKVFDDKLLTIFVQHDICFRFNGHEYKMLPTLSMDLTNIFE